MKDKERTLEEKDKADLKDDDSEELLDELEEEMED